MIDELKSVVKSSTFLNFRIYQLARFFSLCSKQQNYSTILEKMDCELRSSNT